jgi:hypothetical protein
MGYLVVGLTLFWLVRRNGVVVRPLIIYSVGFYWFCNYPWGMFAALMLLWFVYYAVRALFE